MGSAWRWFRSGRWRGLVLIPPVLVAYYFALPPRLFTDPYSPVVEARDGTLLSAGIASDGQWRFPESDTVPSKFAAALIAFEDRRFRSHNGVDIRAMARALRQNLAAGKVVSGGSTISMQVIRLSRKHRPRTVLEKFVEGVLATRLELRYSKDEILALYAGHAPFGGNVVGLEAACWRYFGRRTRDLSWGEAALLAVLPNAPALVHPGRNRQLLKTKRNGLLRRLYEMGTIDELTFALACEEPVPDAPLPLPRSARHLLRHPSMPRTQRFSTTLDASLQRRCEEIIADHREKLAGNRIDNAAALVARVGTGEVLAYIGNVAPGSSEGVDVDIIRSPRSTGSVLKPFLYAAMLDEGKLLPASLVPDIPTFINGFTPQNFARTFDGAVRANEALVRSLNIPAVHMLRDYRYEKFHGLLTDLGMTTLSHPPDHYGLSVVLGGAEGTLWDLAAMYASMARSLNNYFTHPGKNRYDPRDYRPLHLGDAPDDDPAVGLNEHGRLSAAAIYATFNALRELSRPGDESGWRHFESARPIAWKTGTSFGFRDGWAIGVTPEYVVAVWVGNADGEGRPGLTGIDTAAPIMFDIFSQLGDWTWFSTPRPEMVSLPVCRLSGHRPSGFCPATDTLLVPSAGLGTSACPYHRRVHLSADGRFLVNAACEAVSRMREAAWFVLPPAQEHYYRKRMLWYEPLPPVRPGCPGEAVDAMELIYPRPGSRIFLPRQLNGEGGQTVFQLAHSNPRATVFWHIDGKYLGQTRGTHHFSVQTGAGEHILTLVDELGQVLEQKFSVISAL